MNNSNNVISTIQKGCIITHSFCEGLEISQGGLRCEYLIGAWQKRVKKKEPAADDKYTYGLNDTPNWSHLSMAKTKYDRITQGPFTAILKSVAGRKLYTTSTGQCDTRHIDVELISQSVSILNIFQEMLEVNQVAQCLKCGPSWTLRTKNVHCKSPFLMWIRDLFVVLSPTLSISYISYSFIFSSLDLH